MFGLGKTSTATERGIPQGKEGGRERNPGLLHADPTRRSRDIPDASSSPSPCFFGNSWDGAGAGRAGTRSARGTRSFPEVFQPIPTNRPGRSRCQRSPPGPGAAPGEIPQGTVPDPGNPGNPLPAPGRAWREPRGRQTLTSSRFFPLLQMFLSLFHVVFSFLHVVFPCSRFIFLPSPGSSPSSRFLFLLAPIFFPSPAFFPLLHNFLSPLPIFSIPAPAFFPFSTFFLPLFQGFSFPAPGYFSPSPVQPPHIP